MISGTYARLPTTKLDRGKVKVNSPRQKRKMTLNHNSEYPTSALDNGKIGFKPTRLDNRNWLWSRLQKKRKGSENTEHPTSALDKWKIRSKPTRLDEGNWFWSRLQGKIKGSEMKLKLVCNNKVSTPHPSPLTTGYSRTSLKRKIHPLPSLSDSKQQKSNKFWSRLQKTGCEMKSKLTNNNKGYKQVRLERTNTYWSRSQKKTVRRNPFWVTIKS